MYVALLRNVIQFLRMLLEDFADVLGEALSQAKLLRSGSKNWGNLLQDTFFLH